MNTKALILLGIGAFLIFGMSGGQEKYFTIPPGMIPQMPNGGSVPESQLPSLGFVKYQGQWYHQTQFAPTQGSGYEGINTNSGAWYNVILNSINTGLGLFNLVSSTGLIPGITRILRTTAVNWTQKTAAIDVKNGNLVLQQTISQGMAPISRVSDNGTYAISVGTDSAGNTLVKLFYSDSAGNVTVSKQGTINWTAHTLTGFDAGSISGTPQGELPPGKSLHTIW